MRAKLAALTFSLFFGAATLPAQDAAPAGSATNSPDYTAINCSGFVTDKVPDDIRVISGEQSNPKVTWSHGDYVYINRGRDKGVQVGDRFSVIRPDKDPMDVPWFKWQHKLIKAMGQLTSMSASFASSTCNPTVQSRKSASPAAGCSAAISCVPTWSALLLHSRTLALSIICAGERQARGHGRCRPGLHPDVRQDSTVYVNLGSNQSVRIGDYFRIFRYQGTLAETAPQTKGYGYKMYGSAAPPKSMSGKICRAKCSAKASSSTKARSSTVLITSSRLTSTPVTTSNSSSM